MCFCVVLQGRGDGNVPIESSSERFSGESAQLAPVRKLRCAVVRSALAPSKPWHGHQLPQGPSGLVFTRPPAQLHWSQAPGPQEWCPWTSCGALEGLGLRPWPFVHVSRKPPAAQAASVSRGRTRGLHDVLWVLSLHCCQQRWTLAAPGAMGRDRGPAPKPHGPWVQLGFQLCAWTACCRLFPGTCQGRSPGSCG